MTRDGTLGGYQEAHGRPPAFGGADGLSYSVSTFVGEIPDASAERRYGAALLFVRWSGSDKPAGHLESDYLAFGASPDAALRPLLALSLREVKAHLDQCVAAGTA